MTVKNLFQILVLATLCWGVAEGAPRRAKKKVVPKRPTPLAPVVVQPPEMNRRISRGIAETPVGKISRFKFVNLFGMNAVSGAGLLIGAQFGYAPNSGMKFYWGPTIDFTLFSRGYLMNLLGGFWYEWKCLGADNLSIHLGAQAGAGFATYVDGLKSANLVAYVDTALATEIDELVTLRGQLKPGFVGNRFAFAVNFNVMFRFY